MEYDIWAMKIMGYAAHGHFPLFPWVIIGVRLLVLVRNIADFRVTFFRCLDLERLDIQVHHLIRLLLHRSGGTEKELFPCVFFFLLSLLISMGEAFLGRFDERW